jgi:adenylate cyclase
MQSPPSLNRPERPVLRLPEKPSVAVLPFLNKSGDPDQEYLVDGITEDIITALAKVALVLRDSEKLELHLQKAAPST